MLTYFLSNDPYQISFQGLFVAYNYDALHLSNEIRTYIGGRVYNHGILFLSAEFYDGILSMSKTTVPRSTTWVA